MEKPSESLVAKEADKRIALTTPFFGPEKRHRVGGDRH